MSKHKGKWKDYGLSYCFVAPYLILFIIFTVIPVVWAIILGFTQYNMMQQPTFVGLQNYIRLFVNDDIFSTALKNTFIIAFVTGPIGYIFALILAWLLVDLKKFSRTFLTVLFYAPSISGGILMIWTLIFSSDSYGYLNSMLLSLGLIDVPILWLQDTRYILAVVIIVSLWASLGTSFLAFIAGLQGIDRSLFEAGAMDGIRNRWQELWYITLPSIRPMLMFGALMQITSAFACGSISASLAGSPSLEYSAQTVINHINDYTNRFELGYACAIATLLFVIMLVANKFVQQLLKLLGE